MVRNRYLRIERGRWLTEQGRSKNRCGQCGELKRGHMCRVPRAMVATSLAAQEQHHQEMRLAKAYDVDELMEPGTPGGSTRVAGGMPLALGAPPLTMPLHAAGDSEVLSSPGLFSCGISLGLSPLGTATTPKGAFTGLSGGPPSLSGGPPSLRAQNSMDILLQASDLHRIRASGETPTPTPLATEFEPNPFKLPRVRARYPPRPLRRAPRDLCTSLRIRHR